MFSHHFLGLLLTRTVYKSSAPWNIELNAGNIMVKAETVDSKTTIDSAFDSLHFSKLLFH